MNNDFEANVIQVIQYFSFFKYVPNFEEIHTFLKRKVSKKHLTGILEKMTKENSLTRKLVNSVTGFMYTTPQYSIYFRNRLIRQQISKNKLKKIRLFIKLISWLPQIQLVGLSGTVAMMNAKEKDDIDLFIVTAKKRLWTARIIGLILAELLGVRRKPGESEARDKVCMNLFFDESNLSVPKHKQTEYVAHEVLQMKPLINKNFTYERFLNKNKWVYKIFPNAKRLEIRKRTQHNLNFLGNLLEFYLKKLELTIIKQHQTNEIVTDTQLWFFPEDFEKKLISSSFR